MQLNGKEIKTIHFVGIKGVAMTALALYCHDQGIRITGSDVADDFPTKDVLGEASFPIFLGFSEDHISGLSPVPDLVIYTGAHGGEGNPEIQRARNMGIDVLPHGKALGEFMKKHIEVSVAGSHGKTTTSAMIATILAGAGLDPSYAIGCGSLRPIGNPGHFGKGDVFIAEADEYLTDPQFDRTPRFFWQNPDIFVVTNIDYDHPDAYASIEAVKKAFEAVQKKQKGIAVSVVNADDPNSAILSHPKNGSVITFGVSPTADYRVSDIYIKDNKTIFSLSYQGENEGIFEIGVPGVHNAINAVAAIAAARILTISWDDIRKSLSTFNGTKRRFEIIGTCKEITVVDDYAHHPKEIETTLHAARAWFGEKRIISVFQPHTYSRTRALLKEFVHSFSGSDIVLIADIYASARESIDDTMTADSFVKEMSSIHSHVRVKKTYNDVELYLDEVTKPGDVILFLGAGDIALWSAVYFDHLETHI